MLTAEQKATNYRSVDDSLMADHRPTTACTRFYLIVYHILSFVPFSVFILILIDVHYVFFSRVVAYLSRVLESAYTVLEGLSTELV